MKSPPKPAKHTVRVDETGLRLIDLDNRCAKCGGLAEAERYPKHAAGCRCDYTKLLRSQRKAINTMAKRGNFDPFSREGVALLQRKWTPEGTP